MDFNSKHILGVLTIISVGIIAYYQLPDAILPDEGVKLTTGTTVSSEAIETDTAKRLETLTNSGTAWGMSPFGSGKPLTEEEKPKFQKPNLKWKTRTISGVTYVFGEGNPKEVALPESEMIACNRQDDAPCTDNGAGYVDPLLERLVYDVLNSSDWEPLLQNCKKEFLNMESSINNGEGIFYHESDNKIDLSNLWNLHNFISLEEVFLINPNTGRKNISKEGYNKLMNLLGYLTYTTFSYNNSALGVPEPNYSKCVDTYGVHIINTLLNIRSLPWRGSKDVPLEQ
jgi:hypothetical protein